MCCETVTTKAGITKYKFQEPYIDPFVGSLSNVGATHIKSY